jgi:hypothetical protein
MADQKSAVCFLNDFAKRRIVKKEEALIPIGLMPSITGLSDMPKLYSRPR